MHVAVAVWAQGCAVCVSFQAGVGSWCLLVQAGGRVVAVGDVN